jgi:hypothetical protein
MLIGDLLKHTSKTHPDYENLKKALDTVKEIANCIPYKIL